MQTNRIRRLSVLGGMVLGILAATGVIRAHDFWLIPNAFIAEPGEQIEILGQTSSAFPTSEAAVTPARIASARLMGAASTADISDLSARGTSLLLRHRQPAEGQYLVAVQLKPRSVRESPESFRRYLTLEGAPEALARYEREGLLPTTDSVTRRYAKYAKTLVQVGRGSDRSFHRNSGHTLELTPLSDPAAVQPGQALSFQLSLNGRPLAGAHVHAGAAPFGSAAFTDTAAARAARSRDLSLTTAADGKLTVPIDRAGLWNIRTLQIVPAAAGSGADWDVHWATFVFSIAAPRMAAPTPATRHASDSSDVLGVVDAFHHALAAGDSSVALALLAPDVVILESGGSETRDEYRAHHLAGDIAFARAVPSRRVPLKVTIQGDVAWISATSIVQGQFRDRQINSAGAELVVLSRSASGRWLIRAIHWSSRVRRN
ncbi:MAG: DUF4198 domain-containing protein [Gemmatimonadaceae bacterium]